VADPQLFDMARAPLKESVSPKTVGKEIPSPYSTDHRITLNNEDASKLGLGDVKVGDVFDTAAEGHVVGVDQTDSENGKSEKRVHIQMQRMAAKKRKGNGAQSALEEGIASAPAQGADE